MKLRQTYKYFISIAIFMHILTASLPADDYPKSIIGVIDLNYILSEADAAIETDDSDIHPIIVFSP